MRIRIKIDLHFSSRSDFGKSAGQALVMSVFNGPYIVGVACIGLA